MEFVRDEEKNNLIKQRLGGKGIGFEDVEKAIRDGNVIKRIANDNLTYRGQEMFIVMIDNYPYKVPFREENDTFYLITAYPSRKFIS